MSTRDERVTHLIDWINHASLGLLDKSVIEIPDCGREDLAYVFARLRFDSGVEVGTERGLYANTLLEANLNLYLDCVDPYRPYHGYREHTSVDKLEAFYMEAYVTLSKYPHVSFVRDFSEYAHYRYDDEVLDFVFIDANHSLLHVIQDLHYWVPKVKQGGIIAGHDWISRKDPAMNMHVMEAVTAYVSAYNIKPLFLLGRKEIREGEVRDRPRSWLFIKE
jgi:hypothetical protein